MKIMVMRKETDEELIYDGVKDVARIGTLYENGDVYRGPFMRLFMEDGTTATYRMADWDFFLIKRM